MKLREGVKKKECGPGQSTWVPTPILPIVSYATTAKFLNLSMHLSFYMRITIHRELVWELNEIVLRKYVEQTIWYIVNAQ